MPTKIQFTTLACALALAFAGSAQASPASEAAEAETISVRVSLADLDLSQDADLAAAHQRIHRAAVLVCGNEPASPGLLVYGLYINCRRTAFNDAVKDLNAQITSTVAQQSSPKSTALAANR